jgi:hypothetical protein
MENQIHIPLDLPDVRILDVTQLSPQGWLIRVESTLKGSICAKCGRAIEAFHGYDAPLRLRHLPILDRLRTNWFCQAVSRETWKRSHIQPLRWFSYGLNHPQPTILRSS